MEIQWVVLEDPVIVARLVLQVFLFAASALFSMSETALFSLRETDLMNLEAQRDPKAERLRDLINEPRQLIVSILCGNELINIAATINLAGILLALLGNPQAAALANTVVMLPLLLLFGEITPKTLAVTRPVMLSRKIIEPVITPWVWLVMPLRSVVRFAADKVTSLFVGEGGGQQNILGADEFRTLLSDVEQEGVVNTAERRVIVNLIEAGSTPAIQIMVPRPRVAFIDAELSVPEIIDQFRRLRHRRVPIYRGSRDEVLGVIKEQRVLDLVTAKPASEITLEELLEPAKMVPITQTIGEIAEYFKEGDHHAVLIVNEFGGIEGLVTADDVFGFLTAGTSIHLKSYEKIEQTRDGAICCAGLAPIHALQRAINLPLEYPSDISTVGGLVMALLNRVPTAGDEVTESGWVFRVESMSGLLIEQVLIAPVDHPTLSALVVEDVT